MVGTNVLTVLYRDFQNVLHKCPDAHIHKRMHTLHTVKDRWQNVYYVIWLFI